MYCIILYYSKNRIGGAGRQSTSVISSAKKGRCLSNDICWILADATENWLKASTLHVPPNSTFVPFCSNLLTSPPATNTGNERSVYFQAVILTGSWYFTPYSVYRRDVASAPNKNADCFGFQAPYLFILKNNNIFFQLILFIACFLFCAAITYRNLISK